MATLTVDVILMSSNSGSHPTDCLLPLLPPLRCKEGTHRTPPGVCSCVPLSLVFAGCLLALSSGKGRALGGDGLGLPLPVDIDEGDAGSSWARWTGIQVS